MKSPPAIKPPPLPASEKASAPRRRSALVRAVMLLVLVGSAALVWWSVNRLTLANRQLKQKTSTVSALADEVQRLERASQPPDVGSLDARFEQAKKLLFSGPAEYSGLENDLREQAVALQFEPTVVQGAAQSQTNLDGSVVVIPTAIELEPATETFSRHTSYERLLSFTRALQKTGRRVDLVDLHVVGGSNSVRQARAVLQLWSQEADQ